MECVLCRGLTVSCMLAKYPRLSHNCPDNIPPLYNSTQLCGSCVGLILTWSCKIEEKSSTPCWKRDMSGKHACLLGVLLCHWNSSHISSQPVPRSVHSCLPSSRCIEVLKDQEKNDISAWSHVLRRNPPERCAARAHGLASFFSSGGPCRAMPCRELMPSH